MTNTTNETAAAVVTVLTYGTSASVDFAALPAASQMALARRGWSHYLGNEQSSKLTGWKETQTEANKAAGRVDGDGNGLPPTDDEVSAKKSEFIDAAVKALLDGTIGTGAGRGGPRLLPFDQACTDIAKAEVTKVLRGAGIKVPKGDETVKFPDGEKTMAQMVATYIERNKDKVTKEANKRVAEAKRIADKAAAAKATGPVSATDLGL